MTHFSLKLQFYLEKNCNFGKLKVEKRFEEQKMDLVMEEGSKSQLNQQADLLLNKSDEFSQKSNCENSVQKQKHAIQGKNNFPNHIKIVEGKKKDFEIMSIGSSRPKNQKKNPVLKEHRRIQNQQSQQIQNGAPVHKQNKLNVFPGGKLNKSGLNGFENQNYNNQELIHKINIQQSKNYDFKNQKIFISQNPQKQRQKETFSLNQDQLSMLYKNPSANSTALNSKLNFIQTKKIEPDITKSIKPKQLPIGFRFLVEMLNLSYIFPQTFKFEQETIFKIVQTLQAPFQNSHNQTPNFMENQLNQLLDSNFKEYLKSLTFHMIQDLNSEKLQQISNIKTHNILSLAKFCQENQFFQFLLKYNWPLIILELVKESSESNNVTLFDKRKEKNSQYEKSLSFIEKSAQNGNLQIPQSFDLKFEIISLLIDCYSKTSLFRDIFNRKIESNRNMSKRKSDLEDSKRNIQHIIKKILNKKEKKSKKIIKKDKKKKKEFQSDSPQQNQKQEDKIEEEIQNLQKELQEIISEIQKQNRQDSLSCCHYLGKDHNNNLYWFVSYFSDKVFIQNADSRWTYLTIDQITTFLQCLNRKNINENRLFEKIQEYYQGSIQKHLCKMEIETEENNVHSRPANLIKTSSTILQKNLNNYSENVEMELQHLISHQNQHQQESSKNSNEDSELLTTLGAFKVDRDSLFRMIEVAQKKMTQYLKDRNSRWGSPQNKQHLFSILKKSSPDWLDQAKKQISLFNEKICVVQIQYKVFVQQSAEQVDSKIKKIQTKIWGINEKYKHNWYDFINSCTNFPQLFYAVSVLYSLIKKYTSKHRKLRKQYEEVKQKTVWKVSGGIKEWKQHWNEVCEVCGLSGEVLCCDFCPKVYHLDCVNLKDLPAQQFKCKSCKEQITTRNQLKSLAHDSRKYGKG